MEKVLKLHEVADLLGVSPNTLRNWDKSGKLSPLRDSSNGYRVYSYKDVKKILSTLKGQMQLFDEETNETSKRALNSQSENQTSSPLSLKALVKLLNRAYRDSSGCSLLERFEEVTKLLFTKYFDERSQTRQFVFNDDQPAELIFDQTNRLYKMFLGKDRELFSPIYRALRDDKAAVKKAAMALSRMNLMAFTEDIKGFAFEEFVRNTFDKTDNQQFFTPQNVAEFIISSLDLSKVESACDPACGSGGFLLELFKKKKSGLKLAGFEIDSRMAWVSYMNLKMSGVQTFEISHFAESGSLGREVFKRVPQASSGFDLIVTNPPFGSDFTGADLKHFKTGLGRSSRRRGILFTERCIEMTKPGGQIAIILDESVLNGETNQDLRELIVATCDVEAVISLPEETFMPYATVKSSVLFLRKKKTPKAQNTATLMSIVEKVGRKPNGEPLYRPDCDLIKNPILDSELPEVAQNLSAHLKRKSGHQFESGQTTFFVLPDQAQFATRLDALYYHPIRAKTEHLKACAKVPLIPLGQLVVERSVVTIPKDSLAEESFSYIGLANIEPYTGVYRPETTTGDKIKSAVKYYQQGDILFSKLRPELRKVILIASEGEDGFVSSECFVFQPKDVEPEYLTFMLRSDFVFGQIMYQVTGIGRPRISKSALMDVVIPVPSAEKQRAIIRNFTRAEAERLALLRQINELTEATKAKMRAAENDAEKSLFSR